jgi:putative membrane protein
MIDKIRTTDTEADIDFYSIGTSSDKNASDLNLEALKSRTTDQASVSADLEDVVSVKLKISWLFWMLLFAAVSFLLFNGYALATTVLEAYQSSPSLAAVMALSSLGFIGLLGYGITKEVLGFLSLKRLGDVLDLQNLRAQNNQALTLKKIEGHANAQRKSDLASSFNQRFFASIQPHHSNDDVLDMYISNVEEPLLRKAQEILKQEAMRSGGVAFISPNEFIQTLTLLWTNLRVLRLISQLYGIRPGLLGNIKLLGMMWQNVLLQNATDVLAEQLVKDISHKFLGTIAEKASVAATSGGLTVRLGLQLIKQLSLITRKG